MTRAEIEAKIAKYQKLVDADGVPEDEKEFARDEIKELQAELAAMKDEPKKTGRPKGVKNQKKRKEPQAFQPGDKINGVLVMNSDGEFVDTNGAVLKIGHTVEFPTKGGKMVGTLANFAKFKGGGHSVSVVGEGGRKRGTMVPPDKVTGVATVDYDKKLPEKIVKKAVVKDRKDCDDNQVVLVTPSEKTALNAPVVADPQNGDMLMLNKKGYPIAVVEGEAVKSDYETAAKAKVEVKGGKVDKVINEPTDEKEEDAKDKAETPDKKIKKAKPPKDCSFLKNEDEPALQTFLEGMRQMWQEDQTADKVERIVLSKEDKKIILQVRRYFFAQIMPKTHYYSVCLSTGKLTPVKKLPTRDQIQVIPGYGLEGMKDFYREPNSNKCRRMSRELHVECYRNGNCTDERKKELLKDFTETCRKREDESTRAYRKYVHSKASERYSSYTGEKSYPQIYREVIAQLKKGK
jgi:hypothetical protein